MDVTLFAFQRGHRYTVGKNSRKNMSQFVDKTRLTNPNKY